MSMSHETSQSQIVLQAHNFNFPPKEIATNTLSDLRNFLYDVSGRDGETVYDGGFQITPTRAIMGGLRTQRAAEFLDLGTFARADLGQPLFSSGEQSWSRGLWGGATHFAKHPRGTSGKMGLGVGTIIQEQTASLKGLEQLQRLTLSGKMHAVVYGGHWKNGKLAEFKGHSFESVSLQLEPEQLSDRWGRDLKDMSAETYQDIDVRLADQGIDGLTIDPLHLWRAHNIRQDERMNWVAALGAIKSSNVPVIDLHVPVGRIDRPVPEDRERSMQEMETLLFRPELFKDTQSGEILQAGVEIWHDQNESDSNAELHAVVEMPHGALARLGLAGTRQDVFATNRLVANNLRGFLEVTLKDAQTRNPGPAN